jgi:hypothetical protein
MAGMKPGQFSLGSLFWMVTLAAAIIAASLGAAVFALPVGIIAAFILADRYRKRMEADPEYIPPTEEEIAAEREAQTQACYMAV